MGTSHADSGDSQTVLHKECNKGTDWYEKVADAAAKYGASYFLLWANFGKHDGYYTPYVDKVNDDGTLHGHETLDGFINRG